MGTLEGNALALLAYQNLTIGQPAASLAEASCRAAGKSAPPRVRALLNERRAWVIAHEAGRAEAPARRALDIAVAALDDDQAVPILETALGGFDDRQARDKALYLTWLAEACIAAGDIEQAAAITGRVISLADGVASVRPAQRVAFLLRSLRARSSAPYVTELAGLAAGFTPATCANDPFHVRRRPCRDLNRRDVGVLPRVAFHDVLLKLGEPVGGGLEELAARRQPRAHHRTKKPGRRICCHWRGSRASAWRQVRVQGWLVPKTRAVSVLA